MLDADEVHKLQHRLNTHREHLSILLDQAASFGSAVPAHIVIDIRHDRAEIAKIKTNLRENNVTVGDHPDDDDGTKNVFSSVTSVIFPPMNFSRLS